MRSLRWVMVVLLVACSGQTAVSLDEEAQPESATTTSTTTTTVGVSTTTQPTTTTTILSTEILEEGQALVGRAAGPLQIFGEAGDETPQLTIEDATVLGTPRVYLVLEGPVEGWVLVSLPIRPNGSTGWARASDLEISIVFSRIEVDLSERTLVYFEEGKEVLSTAVAIGSASNPTPPGFFYVTDAVAPANPQGPWGPFAFGLSAYSDTITEFNGAGGIIGIHGTNRPATIGTAASLGCVRVPNEVISELRDRVVLGIPVLINE
jgi:lipoprotein-anchoring transpeptidase ErfK/SrfK